MAVNSTLDRRLATRDRLIAASLAVISFAAFMVFAVKGIDPAQWEEVSVAAGLRPPMAIFPGVWRILTGWLFAVFGISFATKMLTVVGSVVGAASVALVYLLAVEILTILVRLWQPGKLWRRRIAPFFGVATAVFVGASDPFWDMSQSFTPEGLHFLLFLFSFYLWMRWFARGGAWRLYPAVAIVGLLAAETPLAFLIPIFFIGWYFKLWNAISDGVFEAPEYLPDPATLPKWRMFFLFLGVLVFTAWANVQMFASCGGAEANGWTVTDAYFRYGTGYLRMLLNSATPAGWGLCLGFGVFPAVVALRLFPVVTREDRGMPFHLGVVMFFVGFIALLQTGVFPAARFWMFSKETVLVSSNFVLSFCSLASAMTVGAFGAAFALECQRLYLPPEEPKPGKMLRYLVPVITAVFVLIALVRVPRPVEAEAQEVVNDAVAETVRECEGADYVFTDGRLDAGLELAASAIGRKLVPLNMMSGASAWEKAVRTRSFPAGNDHDLAETGIPMLLRVWACEKDHGMDKAAIQLGFDIWKRARKSLPALSGMVARESGMSDEAAKRGIESSKALSERVVRACERIADSYVSPSLAAALSAVSWRLSRLARLRNDEKLADRLDSTNGTIKRMLSIIEYERQRTFMQLTPYEGLEIALKRADFVEAKRYALAVMRGDKKNPEANFGMAMSCLKDGDLKGAEKHLRVVLEKRPDEPAALNNLSIICRKDKRYDEALKFARHALKMLPDSPEVKQTLADAEAKKP